MDLGVYTIYPMVVLFGRPKKISATGLKLFTGADGQGSVNFEYEGMDATVMSVCLLYTSHLIFYNLPVLVPIDMLRG